jgi:hypothetical protein
MILSSSELPLNNIGADSIAHLSVGLEHISHATIIGSFSNVQVWQNQGFSSRARAGLIMKKIFIYINLTLAEPL